MGYKNKATKIAWIKTGTEPTVGKKTTGFAADEKWPYQYANWIHWIITKVQNWLQGSNEDWIVIDSDIDEGDYTSLVDYIADAPAAGDHVLLKVDEVLTAKLTLPDGIRIKQKKGVKISTATDLSEVIEIGSDVEIEGDFNIELSHTGTIVKAVQISGGGSRFDNIKVENISTGTVTNTFYIESGAAGNKGSGESLNSGGGSITNVLVDNSGEINNIITIVEI